VRAPRHARGAEHLATVSALTAAVADLAQACRTLALPIEFDGPPPLPPCVFDRPRHVAPLLRLSMGSRVAAAERPPECGACVLSSLCPGPAAPTAVRALRDAHLPRLFGGRPARPDGQVHALRHARLRFADGVERAAATVYVTTACNQGCRFCFVPLGRAEPPDTDKPLAVREAGGAGLAVVLSGGEPTLHPELMQGDCI
jgi:hypothetical protein